MDFEFLQNPITRKWIVSAPRRAKRPNVDKGTVPVCPFCVGKEEKESYRVLAPDKEFAKKTFGVDSDWLVRVIPNKYPFAPIHEIVIHSPDHAKNFDLLPLTQVRLILETYKKRYLEHEGKGQVFIFHNRGKAGGESITHPHTQIVVIPDSVSTDLPRLDPNAYFGYAPHAEVVDSLEDKVDKSNQPYDYLDKEDMVVTEHFYIFCPQTSQWPDEVWVAPKNRGKFFGEIEDEEITDFTYVLTRLIQIFNHRHGNEFSFNFYIYPGKDWYLRLIPRVKTIGGFELCTGIFVNTQDPHETLSFIKTHYSNPDPEMIRKEFPAEYRRGV